MKRILGAVVVYITLLASFCYSSAAIAYPSSKYGIFDFPIENLSTTITCGWLGYSHHYGYDLGEKYGTAIYAIFDGTVTYKIRYNKMSDGKYHSWSYGNYLELQADSGLYADSYMMRVAHLSKFAFYEVPKRIPDNDSGIELVCDHPTSANRSWFSGCPEDIIGTPMHVKKGTLIGYSGSCGNSTGDHLHIEIIKNGSAQNPLDYISNKKCAKLVDIPLTEDFFPDENFRTYLKSNFATELFTPDDIARVKRIVCTGKKITSLKGIEYFSALTFLNCQNNNITELDLAGNPSLTFVNCSNNEIKSLNVGNNSSLKELYCNNNAFTELDVQNNTALIALDCAENNLSTLDVSKNLLLGALDCANNNLTTLNVSNNTALYLLECQGNKLTNIDVSKNTALKQFFCQENQLITLNLANNKVLYDLDCSNNQIATLNLENNTELKQIVCRKNKITILDLSNCVNNVAVYPDPNVNVIRRNPEITITTLYDGVVNQKYSFTLSAQGPKPITWSVKSGMPSGLSINSSTGEIYGTPKEAGTFYLVITVTNPYSSTSKTLKLQINSNGTKPTIITSSIPEGTVGKNYSAELSANGILPITWSASGLPLGLSINVLTGKISGTVKTTGTFSVTISAKNSLGTTTKVFELKINNSGIKPLIQTSALSDGKIGQNYDETINAIGDTPMTWSVLGLPEGLTINSSTGKISGTPKTAGTFSVTITAKNPFGSDSKNFDLSIKGNAPVIITSSLPDGTVGKSYSAAIKVTGSAPIKFGPFGIAGNNSGVSDFNLNTSTGEISGLPTQAGTFTVFVTVSNKFGTVSKNLKFTIKVAQERVPDSKASKIRALMGKDNEVPLTRLTGVNTFYNQEEAYDGYDDEVAAVLEDVEIASTGIYLIQQIKFRSKIPAGAYLTWHNSDESYDAMSAALNSDCVFLDDYDNEITSPTEIDLYQVNAAVYLEGGKTYSPFITAEYDAGDGGSKDTRDRNDSGSSGGGCTFGWGIEAIVSFIFLFSMFLNRKFI